MSEGYQTVYIFLKNGVMNFHIKKKTLKRVCHYRELEKMNNETLKKNQNFKSISTETTIFHINLRAHLQYHNSKS